jgi:hypothetical protein
MRHPHHYDPNQPRVPEGHEDGGQWTDAGGTKHAQTMTDVSASARRLLRRLVLPPAPDPSPLFQLGARAPWLRGTAAVNDMESARSRFDELSLHNSPEQRAILAFKVREYVRNQAPVLEALRVGILSRSEIGNICNEFATVQGVTDAAAADVQAEERPMDAGQYGTAVHQRIKLMINGPKPDKSSADVRSYSTLWAEQSYAKTYEERRQQTPRDAAKAPGADARWGEPGSIRVDVFEEVNLTTACVYDVKTGRRGLSGPHMLEIAVRIALRLGKGARIIVMEMRPTHPRVLTPRP